MASNNGKSAPPKKLLVIYNPHAGHKRAKKLLPQIEEEFSHRHISLDILFTESPKHATELVKGADFSQYNGLVAAGGDGTLFEVINGYFNNTSKKRIPIGVLPVGTGNAFARDLGLENHQWQNAVDIISRNQPRAVDVGRFAFSDQEFYYLNILGLGFVSDVTKTAVSLKLFGNISYTIGVLYQTIFLKTHHLMLEIDGKSYERDNIFVEISNTRYTSNFLMAPNARFDDGFLDITLLNKLNRRRLLKCLPTVFTGEHIHLDEVETFQAKQIRIQTDIDKILTPDGEIVGNTPVEVECLHHAVEVFCP
ncbi:diacylglycerol kinase family lipid kinase [candidate division KSB1 bacterium]|nr:diacylglycerol kinase family lipid kinase [candidate division KSB1 bacterium]